MICTIPAAAQTAASSQLRTLANHRPLWANAANDLGPVPAGQAMAPMTLLLERTAQQEADFEQLLADQQNPSSPQYHHWLKPAEIGDRFGLSDEQIASITTWLESEGLHVNWVGASRIFIGFSGSAADINRAFQTELHSYRVNGAVRLALASDPMIPASLAGSIRAVHGLYTIEDRPGYAMTAPQTASPQLTASGTNHFISPADFATIYDVPATAAAGAGETIGIVGRSRTNAADFANFRTITGSTFPNPTEIVPTAFGGVDPGPAYTTPPTGGGSTGDQSEATLDVLRAGSIAPGANLLLVVATSASGGIETDAEYLVQSTPVPIQIMSISFGACESAAGPSGVAFWNAIFQQAAAEGITSFVSSGDSGASGCDTAFATPPASPAANSPNYICSSGYATCVGGTEFNDTANPSGYWSSTNGSSLGSAFSYIPEGGWNEPTKSGNAYQAAGSGGGVSTRIATPAWQFGPGVPAARAGRYTPDISFSSSCHDAYLGCFAAGGASCAITNGSFSFLGFCGTSAAAPSMAAVGALLDQQQAGAQGNINQALYATAWTTPGAFHDTTVASSGVTACDVNTPSMCNNSVPAPVSLTGGQAGYLVGNGYDEVTGLGSLDVRSFLASLTSRVAPQVAVTPGASSITAVQPLSVSIAVTGATGLATPTGSVTLSSGSYSSAATPLNSGNATISIAAGALGAGYETLTAQYSPDVASSSIYSAASGSGTVNVSLLNATLTVTPSASSVTTAQPLTVTVAVGGGSGNPVPTGTVALSSDNYSGSAQLVSGSASFVIAPGLLTVGTAPLSVVYSPDTQSARTYATGYATGSVTVSGVATLTPTVTVTPAATTTVVANPLQVTIAVSGGAGNPTATGAVSLVSGNYSSAATALSAGSASITIPAQSLTVGLGKLTAIYTPDASSATVYNSTSGTATVTVYNPAKSTPIVTIFPGSTNLTTAQSLSVTVTVASNGGYPITTGSVTLSSGSYTSSSATLSTNEAVFTVPAGALAVGTDTLTANYTPDLQSSTIFYAATGTATVAVSTPPAPTFTVSGSSVTVSRGATTGNTSSITLTPANGFTGSVTLTAAVTSSPSGAQNPPTLSFGATSPVSITGTGAVTATLTVSTTAATSAANATHTHPWPWAASGTTLAFLVLICTPAGWKRRRGFFLFVALFALAIGGIAACGGGNSASGGGGGTGNSGTTPGTYTVTVTGASGSTTAQGTITLLVQ